MTGWQKLLKESGIGRRRPIMVRVLRVTSSIPLTGSCSRCGRELKDPKYIQLGIGPICIQKAAEEGEDGAGGEGDDETDDIVEPEGKAPCWVCGGSGQLFDPERGAQECATCEGSGRADPDKYQEDMNRYAGLGDSDE
jgi:hypothetical protein